VPSKANGPKPGKQIRRLQGGAHEWAFANFPGGWIEVLRDGEKLRIEGFEAGSVGVVEQITQVRLRDGRTSAWRIGWKWFV
jgi:hypothetical protein